MRVHRYFALFCLLTLLRLPAAAQDREAPNITGMAVQGLSINLDYYRGDKNVLIVFYRTHD